MESIVKKALWVILLSLGLALIFNYLFFGKQLGISLAIFNAALLGTVFTFGFYQKLHLEKTWWLVLLIAFFAMMPAVRANDFLTFLNVCATFGLLMILANQLAGTPAWIMRLRDYVMLALVVPFQMLGRGLKAFALVSRIHSQVKERDVWVRIIKGAAMALPILILFSILFSKADLAFSQFVQGFVNITISERTMQYLGLLAFAFASGISYLAYIFIPAPKAEISSDAKTDQSDIPSTSAAAGKSIEILVFLSLLAVLFTVFIGFQITYLFGGEANIVGAGFTYAEYARRGFWELLAVSFLSLLILLASEKYAGAESKQDRLFLIPSLAVIAEVVVVIFSAFKRLSLYIDAYGMTMLRFYVAGFIILLFALFLVTAYKFIMSKPERFFAFGALLLVCAFLITVNLINPDSYIVKANAKQYDRTGKIDTTYFYELSADAVQEEIELYKKLDGEDQAAVKDHLSSLKNNIEFVNDHWQSANWSRSKALKMLGGF